MVDSQALLPMAINALSHLLHGTETIRHQETILVLHMAIDHINSCQFVAHHHIIVLSTEDHRHHMVRQDMTSNIMEISIIMSHSTEDRIVMISHRRHRIMSRVDSMRDLDIEDLLIIERVDLEDIIGDHMEMMNLVDHHHIIERENSTDSHPTKETMSSEALHHIKEKAQEVPITTTVTDHLLPPITCLLHSITRMAHHLHLHLKTVLHLTQTSSAASKALPSTPVTNTAHHPS